MTSPEHKKVLSNLQNITDTLRANKTASEALCLKLKMETWIDIADDPSPNEMMKVVLDRIKKDASQFHVFKRFLDDVPGLDLISRQLEAVNTTRRKFTYTVSDGLWSVISVG